ncbi:hypothetical protein FORC89_p145 (plasmid) [Salmonella sp. FORC89]|uniref:Uncharacterized protein n=1 Tax=Salmonella enteritidis (strain 2009K0958) TaxID=1192586 RepID=A0A656IB56_SALE2|nr:hypothetical protein FORC7_p066 [Salmonella enterica subsp. enterica serovar Enteritidis]AOC88909.1 hypothetical protein FORC19_p110 [Salmonella enterica]EPI62513.1 hypothetical protein A673_05097 [Salmonella enterica subsp. enterica serovar Enteritidis str. 2009K0958]EPI80034.1 hypothetical protein A675_04275 [Salmonella enterica subsp. enterica serovar Enteritidis str. 2009K1726]EPI80168.1 hypothetical protein A676_04045 [Salmonella enterica subsp. enterica serovar Enteritidis str. 2010K-0
MTTQDFYAVTSWLTLFLPCPGRNKASHAGKCECVFSFCESQKIKFKRLYT